MSDFGVFLYKVFLCLFYIIDLLKSKAWHNLFGSLISPLQVVSVYNSLDWVKNQSKIDWMGDIFPEMVAQANPVLSVNLAKMG